MNVTVCDYQIITNIFNSNIRIAVRQAHQIVLHRHQVHPVIAAVVVVVVVHHYHQQPHRVIHPANLMARNIKNPNEQRMMIS